MQGQKLASRRFEAWDVRDEFMCREDSLESTATVSRDIDLDREAWRVASEIFWLFNWPNPRETLIRRDIRSFLAGTFPSPSF